MNIDVYKLIIENSPVSILVTDVSGRIEYVNPKFCRLTGYRADEVLGRNPRILKSGQSSEEDYRQLWQVISGGDEWHGEFVNRKKNGELYYESAIITPVMNEVGKITHYLGIKEDITGRILAQRAVMEHSNRLAALLEVGQAFGSTIKMDPLLQIVLEHSTRMMAMERGSIYFIYGSQVKVQLAKPAPLDEEKRLLKTYDLSHFPCMKSCIDTQEVVILSKLDREHLTPAERALVKLKGLQAVVFIPLVLDGKTLGVLALGSSRSPSSFAKNDLEVCQVLATQASLAIKNAWLYQEADKYASDLENYNHELARLNADLKVQKAKAEESDRLKTAFLQNMSHEIRTPMNGIMGFVELLRMPSLKEEKRGLFIEHIAKSSNQLLIIVDDILELSRLDAGDVLLKEEQVNPASVVKGVYEKFLSLVHPELTLSYHSPPQRLSRTLIGDAFRLQQVLEKLVDNALKFTPNGKVSFGYQNMGQGKLRFFVEDSGIGIEASKLTAVFQPFYQVDLSEEREYGGNGLGLTIASRIVEQMGSVLLVESKPGLGSLFYFELALQTSAEASSATADLAVQEGAAYRILVAEDDEVNFMLLQDALMHRVEGYKFDVLQARNGLEAVEKVKESADLSLVLMDIKMPLMDGIEATRRIRELRPDLPIVAQSAYALTTERDAALAAGCDRYLFKPLDLTELLRVVRELLRLPVR